jgi:hypothetical protein
MAFLWKGREFWEKLNIVLKRTIWRIQPYKNIGSSASSETCVRSAKFVWYFWGWVGFKHRRKPIFRSRPMKFTFPDSVFHAESEEVCFRAPDWMSQKLQLIFWNFVYLQFLTPFKCFESFIRKTVSETFEGHIFVISLKFSIE